MIVLSFLVSVNVLACPVILLLVQTLCGRFFTVFSVRNVLIMS